MAFPDRSVLHRRTPVPAAGVEVHQVEPTVRAYAFKIGCTESNAQAAVTWALRWGGTNADAIAAGKKRADKLRGMQPDPDGWAA